MNTIDTEAATRTALELIGISGRSGEEHEVANAVIRELTVLGVDRSQIVFDTANTRTPGGGQIGNLIVTLPGTVKAPRRMLSAHLDTVPLCRDSRPRIEGDRIVPSNPHAALGGDDRAGVAVLVTVLREILTRSLDHPPLTFLWTVQEEVGLRGAKAIDVEPLGNPELCFNFDGGDPSLATIGATGDVAMTIVISGIASHAGGQPEAGVSAATIFSLAVSDLHRDGWHGLIEKPEGTGTSNVGVISGGDATNVVLPELTVRAEARSHDPAFRQTIIDRFETAFRDATASVASATGERGSIRFETELKYESFRLDPETAAVREAIEAITACGLEPTTKISNGGLDANWLTAHGFPCVTLGCGQSGIHTVRETLSLPEFHNACRIGLRLATGG